jgi:hypothetical protein
MDDDQREQVERDWRHFQSLARITREAQQRKRPFWLLTPNEVAARTKRSAGTIRVWIGNGTLPVIPSPWDDSEWVTHLYALVEIEGRHRRRRTPKPKLTTLTGAAKEHALSD